MKLGIKIYAKTEHGGFFTGETAGAFVKKDGSQWVVGETERGEIFFAETQNVKPLRELYGVR